MKREELSEIRLGGTVGADCLYYDKREADKVMDSLEYDIRIYQEIVAKAEARIKELEDELQVANRCAEDARERIKELEQVNQCSQPKWISVGDRLPKNEQMVIVSSSLIVNKEDGCLSDIAIFKSKSIKKIVQNKNEIYFEIKDFFDCENIPSNYVTHWMPLPQPPSNDNQMRF